MSIIGDYIKQERKRVGNSGKEQIRESRGSVPLDLVVPIAT